MGLKSKLGGYVNQTSVKINETDLDTSRRSITQSSLKSIVSKKKLKAVSKKYTSPVKVGYIKHQLLNKCDTSVLPIKMAGKSYINQGISEVVISSLGNTKYDNRRRIRRDLLSTDTFSKAELDTAEQIEMKKFALIESPFKKIGKRENGELCNTNYLSVPKTLGKGNSRSKKNAKKSRQRSSRSRQTEVIRNINLDSPPEGLSRKPKVKGTTKAKVEDKPAISKNSKPTNVDVPPKIYPNVKHSNHVKIEEIDSPNDKTDDKTLSVDKKINIPKIVINLEKVPGDYSKKGRSANEMQVANRNSNKNTENSSADLNKNPMACVKFCKTAHQALAHFNEEVDSVLQNSIFSIDDIRLRVCSTVNEIRQSEICYQQKKDQPHSACTMPEAIKRLKRFAVSCTQSDNPIAKFNSSDCDLKNHSSIEELESKDSKKSIEIPANKCPGMQTLPKIVPLGELLGMNPPQVEQKKKIEDTAIEFSNNTTMNQNTKRSNDTKTDMNMEKCEIQEVAEGKENMQDEATKTFLSRIKAQSDLHTKMVSEANIENVEPLKLKMNELIPTTKKKNCIAAEELFAPDKQINTINVNLDTEAKNDKTIGAKKSLTDNTSEKFEKKYSDSLWFSSKCKKKINMTNKLVLSNDDSETALKLAVNSKSNVVIESTLVQTDDTIKIPKKINILSVNYYKKNKLNCFDILDEITMNDIKPIESEYPRRDHHGTDEVNVKVEQTFLYKMVYSYTNQYFMQMVNVDLPAQHCIFPNCLTCRSPPNKQTANQQTTAYKNDIDSMRRVRSKSIENDVRLPAITNTTTVRSANGSVESGKREKPKSKELEGAIKIIPITGALRPKSPSVNVETVKKVQRKNNETIAKENKKQVLNKSPTSVKTKKLPEISTGKKIKKSDPPVATTSELEIDKKFQQNYVLPMKYKKEKRRRKKSLAQCEGMTAKLKPFVLDPTARYHKTITVLPVRISTFNYFKSEEIASSEVAEKLYPYIFELGNYHREIYTVMPIFVTTHKTDKVRETIRSKHAQLIIKKKLQPYIMDPTQQHFTTVTAMPALISAPPKLRSKTSNQITINHTVKSASSNCETQLAKSFLQAKQDPSGLSTASTSSSDMGKLQSYLCDNSLKFPNIVTAMPATVKNYQSRIPEPSATSLKIKTSKAYSGDHSSADSTKQFQKPTLKSSISSEKKDKPTKSRNNATSNLISYLEKQNFKQSQHALKNNDFNVLPQSSPTHIIAVALPQRNPKKSVSSKLDRANLNPSPNFTKSQEVPKVSKELARPATPNVQGRGFRKLKNPRAATSNPSAPKLKQEEYEKPTSSKNILENDIQNVIDTIETKIIDIISSPNETHSETFTNVEKEIIQILDTIRKVETKPLNTITECADGKGSQTEIKILHNLQTNDSALTPNDSSTQQTKSEIPKRQSKFFPLKPEKEESFQVTAACSPQISQFCTDVNGSVEKLERTIDYLESDQALYHAPTKSNTLKNLSVKSPSSKASTTSTKSEKSKVLNKKEVQKIIEKRVESINEIINKLNTQELNQDVKVENKLKEIKKKSQLSVTAKISEEIENRTEIIEETEKIVLKARNSTNVAIIKSLENNIENASVIKSESVMKATNFKKTSSSVQSVSLNNSSVGVGVVNTSSDNKAPSIDKIASENESISKETIQPFTEKIQPFTDQDINLPDTKTSTDQNISIAELNLSTDQTINKQYTNISESDSKQTTDLEGSNIIEQAKSSTYLTPFMKALIEYRNDSIEGKSSSTSNILDFLDTLNTITSDVPINSTASKINFKRKILISKILQKPKIYYPTEIYHPITMYAEKLKTDANLLPTIGNVYKNLENKMIKQNDDQKIPITELGTENKKVHSLHSIEDDTCKIASPEGLEDSNILENIDYDDKHRSLLHSFYSALFAAVFFSFTINYSCH